MTLRISDDAPFQRRVVRLSLPDLDLELQTEAGLFSHRSIDAGTEVLLRHAPPPPDRGNLLDLGCGYGPVALVLGVRAPRARVWAVDVDDRALEITDANVRRAGLANIVACTPRSVPPDLTFSAIYSNPPTRIGKLAVRSLLSHWLARLESTGNAYLVLKKEAGAEAVARWLSQAGFPTTRMVRRRGYHLLHIAGLALTERT